MVSKVFRLSHELRVARPPELAVNTVEMVDEFIKVDLPVPILVNHLEVGGQVRAALELQRTGPIKRAHCSVYGYAHNDDDERHRVDN